MSRYPDEVVEVVREFYKTLPNKEIRDILVKQFPGYKFPKSIVQCICSFHRFIRSPEDRKVLMKRLVDTGVKRNATIKQHEGKCNKIGDVRFAFYSSRKQWIIKLGPKKHQPYAIYLWVKLHRKVPGGYRVDWIDEKKALTIDNLHLIKFNEDRIPIGGITTWKNGNRRRELIKTAEGKYELLLPYLWRKYNGEIPAGLYVEKVDPFKATTIENLRLTRHRVFDEGSQNLHDWYVKATLSKAYPEGEIPATIMNWQRGKIKLLREIKKKLNELNAGNTQGGSPDNQVEGTCTKDDALFIHGRWYRD